METHLALSGVLAEREYLTSQIALLFRYSAAVCCYATASSKLSGSGPYSPPFLSPPLFLKEKKNFFMEQYFVDELRRADCGTALRMAHLNKTQYFYI